ncbi:MAG: hypothetical protein Q8M29_04405 [Bacteroidota bacterium]|nr:hypothetical protein [Bacteroidota bacterium]
MISVLVPGFLKRLDAKLLVKYPILWGSKLHFVAYYSLLLWVLTSLIALVIPIDLTDMVGNGLYYTFFTIISIVLLCVWLYRNALFNIESEYGNRKKTDEYKVFFVNFLCVFLLFSFAYPFSYVYNIRVANSMSKEELKTEINTLNIAEPFFVRSYYDYSEIQIQKNDTTIADSTEEQYPQYIYKHDITQYRAWNKYTPYRFVTDSSEASYGILTSKEQETAFNQLRNNDSKALQAIQNCINILKKHDQKFDYEATYVLSRYKSMCKEPIEYNNFNDLYDGQFNGNPYKMETILRNVADAQYDNIFIFMWGFNLAMFYFVFYITLFFMLFKSVKWQYFLLTLVVFIVLPILLFIFAMMFSWGANGAFGPIYMTGILLLYLIALVVSLTFIFQPKRFNGFKSICMQVVYICTPVVFLYFIFYLDENTNIFWREYYTNMYQHEIQAAVSTADNMKQAASIQAQNMVYEADYKAHRELYENFLWGSIAFGILFHISFFMVFMKEQFLKMKSLPKNK